MKIAFAGATGFTGRRVAARLAGAGHELRCLVRPTSDRGALPPGAEPVAGDLSSPGKIGGWLAGCEGLVFTASMGFGHVPGVVSAAVAAGVKRALFVSTTGIFTRLKLPSKAVRVAAEDCVRASGLAWTIVRPTMIYGARGDRNMERLLARLAKRAFVPVPGSGKALIQPVHVDDLADAIVAAFGAAAAERNIYNISGAMPLSLNATIDAAASAVGRKPWKVHLPLGPVALTLSLFEAMHVPLPVKSEQVRRLAEDKAFPHYDAARDFAFAPRLFEDGIRDEAHLLGLAK